MNHRIRVTSLCLLMGCSPDDPADSARPWQSAPADQPEQWCDGLQPGPPGTDALAVSLSAAHLDHRLFGPEAEWLSADAVLADILSGADPFSADTLDAYAAAFDTVCAAPATSALLEEATVRAEGPVAVLTPGRGELSLPAGVEVVVVDLRTLPATAEADVALDHAVGLALAGDTPLGTRTVRSFLGFPSQSNQSLYTSEITSVRESLSGTGNDSLPIVFFTGRALSPRAATVAGGLRQEGRAWIVGTDVLPAVAEGAWHGIGDHGLLVRTSRMSTVELEPWPKRIPADHETGDPEALISELAEWGLPDGPAEGRPGRSSMAVYEPLGSHDMVVLDAGARRALLVVAHGIFKRFYPYFEVVDDHTDEALIQALAEADSLEDDDRTAMEHVLGRFMHVLQDGHGFFGGGAAIPRRTLAVQFQQVDGKAVVRTSADPDLRVGDTVVAIDGVDATAWYDEVMARHSAASQGYLFDLATRELKGVFGTRTLTLLDVEGEERTETLSGVPSEEASAVPWGGTYRPSGWLDELDAPGVYFLNLNGTITATWDQVERALDEIPEAEALVVDVRDYPVIDHYTLATWLIPDPFASAVFGLPSWTGDEFRWEDSQYDFIPEPEAFDGPIVLMVSNKTVSAAENFSQMLVTNPAVTVVGEQSASTNGNITRASLPGGFYAMFTGMRILNPDRSLFHGVGIQPDIVVSPEPADFRHGDPELLTALEVL